MAEVVDLFTSVVDALEYFNKSTEDVVWVGINREGNELACTLEHFKEISQGISYYTGYGTEEINLDLIVVGNDFWLERWSYDGSEGWEFKQMPSLRDPIKNELDKEDLLYR